MQCSRQIWMQKESLRQEVSKVGKTKSSLWNYLTDCEWLKKSSLSAGNCWKYPGTSGPEHVFKSVLIVVAGSNSERVCPVVHCLPILRGIPRYVGTQSRTYINRETFDLRLSEVIVMVWARYLVSRLRVDVIYSVISDAQINEDNKPYPKILGSARNHYNPTETN